MVCHVPSRLAVLAVLVLGAADEGTPEAVLKEKGLKRSGAVYVLPREAEFHKKLREAHAAYRQTRVAASRKEEFERGAEAGRSRLSQIDRDRAIIKNQLAQASSVEERDQLFATLDALTRQMDEVRQQSGGPGVNQVPGARLAIARGEFLETLSDLRNLADALDAAYASLTRDEAVTSALDAVNARGKVQVRLGPSPAYKSGVASLATFGAFVPPETVALRKEGVAFWVDVTFPGEATRPMVFADGAPTVLLPAGSAADVGLKVGPGDGLVTVRGPGGKEVEGRKVLIPEMRIGKVTARGVEAVVLPEGRADVGPVLGRSFFRDFTYQFTNEPPALVVSRRAVTPGPTETDRSARRGSGSRAVRSRSRK